MDCFGGQAITVDTESQFWRFVFCFFHPQPRHSKFEKADILEKTVKHLQDLQRQQLILTQAADPSNLNKFKAGFVECAAEVSRFAGIDPVVKRRLLQHLSNCMTGVKQSEASSGLVHILPSPPSSPDQMSVDKMGGRHPITLTAATTTASITAQNSTGQLTPQQQMQGGQSFNHITLSSNGYFLSNGNGGVGVQLIPTKLTNGNIAFVVPPNGLQFQPHQQQQLQQPPSNTPLPMLIPIPNRQQQTSNSASSDSTSASNNSNHSTGSSSTNNSTSSHSSLARSSSTSPHHHYHIQHVTSSPYDRRTPSSSYGSMDSQTMSPPSSPQSSGMCQGPPAYKRARISTDSCDNDADERERDECHSPEPLSLVVRKRCNHNESSVSDADEGDTDKQCWRPW